MIYRLGELVVLRSRWNIHSSRVGVIVSRDESPSDVVLVMWTTKDGVKMKYHLEDAVVAVTEKTISKIEERICDIK